LKFFRVIGVISGPARNLDTLPFILLRFLRFERVSTFPRNLAVVSVLYTGERLEMTSPWHAGASAGAGRKGGTTRSQRRLEQKKVKQKENNHYEDKIT
jgi:hypothetical protein